MDFLGCLIATLLLQPLWPVTLAMLLEFDQRASGASVASDLNPRSRGSIRWPATIRGLAAEAALPRERSESVVIRSVGAVTRIDAPGGASGLGLPHVCAVPS